MEDGPAIGVLCPTVSGNLTVVPKPREDLKEFLMTLKDFRRPNQA